MMQWIITFAVLTFVTGALAFNGHPGKVTDIAHIVFLFSLCVTMLTGILYVTRQIHRGEKK